MPILLMIVARDRPILYERLRDEFDGDGSVAVVIDRRAGERRRQPESVTAEQRRAERRRRRVEGDLYRLGWTTVPIQQGAA